MRDVDPEAPYRFGVQIQTSGIPAGALGSHWRRFSVAIEFGQRRGGTLWHRHALFQLFGPVQYDIDFSGVVHIHVGHHHQESVSIGMNVVP